MRTRLSPTQQHRVFAQRTLIVHITKRRRPLADPTESSKSSTSRTKMCFKLTEPRLGSTGDASAHELPYAKQIRFVEERNRGLQGRDSVFQLADIGAFAPIITNGGGHLLDVGLELLTEITCGLLEPGDRPRVRTSRQHSAVSSSASPSSATSSRCGT